MSNPSSMDLDIGRRSIVAQKKLLRNHLESLIKSSVRVKNASFTREDVYNFIVQVAVGDSYRNAGMEHNISYNTINEWKRRGWIYEAVELAKELANDKLDRKLGKVLNQALDNISSRLEKGDEVVDRGGRVSHRAVSAKDNAIIANIAFDKRQLLRGEATEIKDEKSSEERLKDLFSKFKQFATKDERVIEGEVVAENE